MNEFNLNQKFSKNPDAVCAQIDQDLVVMGPKDELFYGINSLGTEIWGLLESSPLSFEQICQYIQDNYEVDAEKCMSDTQKFIQSLLDQEILVIASAV